MTEFCQNTKCPKDSTVCGELYDFSASETVIGTCISDLYIYVLASGEAKFRITSQYLPGECDRIEENLYTQCGSMSYTECDKCDDECRLANCVRKQRHNSKEAILMNLCLPYTTSKDEVDDRCKEYKDVDVGE